MEPSASRGRRFHPPGKPSLSRGAVVRRGESISDAKRETGRGVVAQFPCPRGRVPAKYPGCCRRWVARRDDAAPPPRLRVAQNDLVTKNEPSGPPPRRRSCRRHRSVPATMGSGSRTPGRRQRQTCQASERLPGKGVYAPKEDRLFLSQGSPAAQGEVLADEELLHHFIAPRQSAGSPGKLLAMVCVRPRARGAQPAICAQYFRVRFWRLATGTTRWATPLAQAIQRTAPSITASMLEELGQRACLLEGWARNGTARRFPYIEGLERAA